VTRSDTENWAVREIFVQTLGMYSVQVLVLLASQRLALGAVLRLHLNATAQILQLTCLYLSCLSIELVKLLVLK
jgi:hypothetical protein